MIYSIQLLETELKKAKRDYNRCQKLYEAGLLNEFQYSSQIIEFNLKIAQLESDVETLKNKYK